MATIQAQWRTCFSLSGPLPRGSRHDQGNPRLEEKPPLLQMRENRKISLDIDHLAHQRENENMSLEGVWYNELKSRMEIKIDKGRITGTYESAVGDAEKQYQLVGYIDPDPENVGTAIGWVVAWANGFKNAHSVTVWSGEYQVINGEEVITTEWLLTIETDPDDDWKSTLVGHDVFTRRLPLEETFAKRSKLRAWPHPT